MSVLKRVRLKGTRQVGLALSGLLVAGLAVASGTALASSGSASSMSGMAQTMSASMHAKTGFTNGWYDGHTVRFFYSKNFSCKEPPASNASSKCEAGADYTQTPAETFDPLYVVVPLGFTPPKWTLQCPVAGHCIDHPHTIDLSAVLGSGTSNLALPAAQPHRGHRQQPPVRVVERGRRRRQEPQRLEQDRPGEERLGAAVAAASLTPAT